ncbi:MAG: YDG domain-containing protein, partial [Comamonas sp.]
MNHIYSVLWNSALGRFYVTSERGRSRSRATPRRARGRGANRRPGFAALAACVAMAWSAPAWSQAALPQGGQVVSGNAAITQAGPQMTIQQASDKTILNWQSFNIGAGHQVTFQQPDASAVALNRVVGADASAIHGTLQANGRVFLVNPNGMLFGAGANVNVGGLVASTLNIADNDFLQGHYQFSGQGSAMQGAALRNQGRITAADGGGVALLGGSVSNQGTIAARLGSVALAAGNQVKLDFAGDGLLNVQVQQASLNALAENHQLIEADGGSVLMTAKATDAILQTVVNNTGTVRARSVENRAGKIVLLGGFEGGTTRVAGTLDASAPAGGNGGFIETSGAHVEIEDGAKVTTLAANGRSGSWLIDPNDFTVARSGGNMTGQQVSDALNHNDDFTIETAVMGTAGGQGDIHINDAITWTQSTLRLNAQRNINVNAVMSVQGSGKLALNYGDTQGNAGTSAVVGSNVNVNGGGRVDFENGGADRLSVNGHGYTVINTLSELSDIQNLGGKYALGSDIDASPTASTAQGFAPIGGANTPFTGVFDGLGHTISRLTINRPLAIDPVGLLSYTHNAVLRNIGLVDGSIIGATTTGALVGYNIGGSISNAYATGSVKGTNVTGGLVGHSQGSRISNAYASAGVSGARYVGGLVGALSDGMISNAYATGSVTGDSEVGGLVGNNSISSITNAYATGSVTGNSNIGGLIGMQTGGVINSVYATGNVKGNSNARGLIGLRLGGSVSYAYWNTETTGQQTSDGTRLTTAQMFDTSKWAGFDFGAVWGNANGQTTPYLLNMAGNQVFNKNDLPTGTITIDNRPVPYTAVLDVNQLQAVQSNLSGRYLLGNDIDASATGDWNGGAGFVPIGKDAAPFSGVFDGLDHAISNLTINRPNEDYVGLFGYSQNAVLRNVSLLDGQVTGRSYVGMLAGRSHAVYASGRASSATVFNAHATGSVSAAGDYAGGLVGQNLADRSTALISNSDAAVEVKAVSYAGGLAGGNIVFHEFSATPSGSALGEAFITLSSASGKVTASYRYAGGLAGINAAINRSNGTASGVMPTSVARISYSYATGQVGANSDAGGLVGTNSVENDRTTTSTVMRATLDGTAEIFDAYATGPVSSNFFAGGLVGSVRVVNTKNSFPESFGVSQLLGTASIARTYATGEVTSFGTPGGGLLGYGETRINGNVGGSAIAAVTDSYAVSSGLRLVGSGPLGVTVTRSEMLPASALMGRDSFAYWSISDQGGSSAIWRIYEGQTMPLLRSFLRPVTIGGESSSVYNGGTVHEVSDWVRPTVGDSSQILGTLRFTTTEKNVGSYSGHSLIASGLYSSQQGYDINYAPSASLRILPKEISQVAGITAVERTYDGNTAVELNRGSASLSGIIQGDDLRVATASGSMYDKNAGEGKDVLITGIKLGGNDAGNYLLINDTASTKVKIDKARIESVNGITADNRTYDGTTRATLNFQGSAFNGKIDGDVLTVSKANANFRDKNADLGKDVDIIGITLGGADARNYTLASTTATATANIAKAEISSVSGITADDRTYDGTTGATLNTQNSVFNGKILGDVLTVTDASGSFVDKNADVGKRVDITGITLGGADARNYTLADTSAVAKANIHQLAVEASIAADGKIYDATTAAITHGQLGGLLGKDQVTLATSGSF